MMRRVAILGPPGSGKSTLARTIGAATGLPVVHLDRYYWRPGWVAAPIDEFAAEHDHLVQTETWVIDGNYGATMDVRFAAADTIIYVDVSAWLCTYRILARMWRSRGLARPDLNDGCRERLTWDVVPFVWYTLTFNRRKRRKVLTKIQLHRDGLTRIAVVRGKGGVESLVASLCGPVVRGVEAETDV